MSAQGPNDLFLTAQTADLPPENEFSFTVGRKKDGEKLDVLGS